MKSYNECLDWLKAIDDLRGNLPEGVSLTPSTVDKNFTLRNVDPKVITQLIEENKDNLIAPKVTGTEDAYFYMATITFGKHEKLTRSYTFSYRNTVK